MIPKQQVISIIVPVYNEKGNIEHFHKQLLNGLENLQADYEILYIDDRSTDGTYEWLKKKSSPTSFSEGELRGGQRRSVLMNVASKGGMRVLRKTGKKGKAYSLVEGFSASQGEILVMIDGDLQYPPEAISEMVKEVAAGTDIIVANRKYINVSLIRKLFSKSFRYFFGNILFGLSTDTQSGLKVFTRQAYETVRFAPTSAWTFDLEFLYRAHQAGFKIANFDINFSPRMNGVSKINVLAASYEIGMNALAVRLKKMRPLIIPPINTGTMQGAGVGHKQKQYITHTTLPIVLSAMKTFSFMQKFLILAFLYLFFVCLFIYPLTTLAVSVCVVSILYFLDALFTVFIITRSMERKGEITSTQEQIAAINELTLPIYSILCPLYKEAHIVPQFLQAIQKLDWPKDKLDVMLLLEEDDQETVATIAQMPLPSYVRIVVVPDSQPKTKPKACNYGLAFASGEYLVIFDAEDIPDPLQLKVAYLGFQNVSEKVICLQAKLNYYNARQNLLTRFFAAEYSLWFDLTLTGLQSLNSAIPLGGTSNHFRTNRLRELQGWDPFNVTEDADLGVRIFQKGYQTSIIDSTTLEEATSKPKNWLRQRSRWIKGYMQTYLVHTRSMTEHLAKYGIVHGAIFQLTVGGKLLFMLLNPLLWFITILYYTGFPFVGPLIHRIYFPPFSYIAVISFVFGNFFFLYCYMIGCARRNQWDLMKYIFLIPIYWLMMSWAGMIALYQLILKPHYWEKTMHGFHLSKQAREAFSPVAIPQPAFIPQPLVVPHVAPVYAQVLSLASVLNTQRALPVSIQMQQHETRKYSLSDYLRLPEFRFSLEFPKISLPRISYDMSGVPFLQSVIILSILFLDIVVAKISFSQSVFSHYLLLSIVTKPFFLLSMLLSALLTRLVTGSSENEKTLRTRIFFSFLLSWITFIGLGLEGRVVVPLLIRDGFSALYPYLPFYTFALLCFSVSQEIVFHNTRKKNYLSGLITLCILSLEMPLSQLTLGNSIDFLRGFAFLSSCNLILLYLLQANAEIATVLSNNVASISGLFRKTSPEKAWQEHRMNILIFNWRDTKHIYAGGAEVYIHELSKRWVQDGNRVTIFCGNDHRNNVYDVIDGVEIYRRGGTYTVYLFAFLYYMLKFRRKYDVIIDCENGIPFFTPLFTGKPVVLLIHHIHQEIFRVFLKFPFNGIAKLLEGKLMPLVYRNRTIVTVSESSRKEIFKLGFTESGNITIVYNGVSESLYLDSQKTTYPSFIYLGRLQKHKNINVAIHAFATIQKKYEDARLNIVGWGEGYHDLKQLVADLHLGGKVKFLGRVNEMEKARLLGESWAMIQPSQIEGWGITVIEANAAGTPVIASRVNGLRDSVVDGKTGILVQVGNKKKFAIAMQVLIEDERYRKQLSLEAFHWSKQFNWNKSAQNFYQLIGRSFSDEVYQPAYSELLVTNIDNN